MTIRDVVNQTGLSHQAVYKRIKGRGLSVSTLKDTATGQLTEEGERLLRELFNLQAEAEETEATEGQSLDETEVIRLRNRVEELTTEVEKLHNRVESLGEKNAELISERDYLRLALERSQQLQMVTASKIPNPPPLLAASEAEAEKSRRGIFRGVREWFARRRNSAGAQGDNGGDPDE